MTQKQILRRLRYIMLWAAKHHVRLGPHGVITATIAPWGKADWDRIQRVRTALNEALFCPTGPGTREAFRHAVRMAGNPRHVKVPRGSIFQDD